jgi:hypothetical protein
VPVPVAATVKLADAPASTTSEVGWVVIVTVDVLVIDGARSNDSLSAPNAGTDNRPSTDNTRLVVALFIDVGV